MHAGTGFLPPLCSTNCQSYCFHAFHHWKMYHERYGADEIRLSHSHQFTREIMLYSPVNNKKTFTGAITQTCNLWIAENRVCFVNLKVDVSNVLNLPFLKKFIKYFMYFRMKVALFFVSLAIGS